MEANNAFNLAAALQVTATQGPLKGTRLTPPPFQPMGVAPDNGREHARPIPVRGMQLPNDYTTQGFLKQRQLGISWPWLSELAVRPL